MKAVKTVFLLVLLSAIFLAIGWVVGGVFGLVIAFVLALGMNFFSYWFSDKLALKMSGSREVTPQQEPHLHRIVDEVSAMAGMPKPKVYIMQNDAPNAFATGRNAKHAAIAATTGIMSILDDRELTAVLGHELGHIRNRDILVGAIVATIATAIMFLAMIGRFSLFFRMFGGRGGYGGIVQIGALLAMIILAPMAAMMIRMAVSRQREYGADETGAQITHTPLALASALEKLETYSRARPMNVNPAVSHLFIVNPFSSKQKREGGDMLSGFFGSNTFSTHPPVKKRVERLNEIARKMGSYA
ncbi:MAG: zinc metalloprotease HtpX [Chloroflexi bacterium]|nr:zinc metalloprotease HtpX [Chloroflexota bacterium]